ncbi:MAG: asparagine synthase C-terminal domain-containing protein [Thermoplasmata archaeon]
MTNDVSATDPYGRLDPALEAALGRLPTEGPLVVLFSGGVDSGLLAWELRRRSGVELSTFGLTGSPDPMAARRAAELLHLPCHEGRATPEEVRSMRQTIATWVGPLTPTEASIETAFALAVKTAPLGTLVCGQGADELFFGYAHYRPLNASAAAARAEHDLALLREVAWPRAQRVAQELGRTVRAPYLDAEFVEAARAVPAVDRSRADPPKAWFRTWAVRRGLPAEIAFRPKKALQYGSGVDRLLKRAPSRP